MSLAIADLETECRVRASGKARAEARAFADRVDRIGREELSEQIAACLGPSLDRDDSVVLIRQIHVSMATDSRNFNAHTFARDWALAFARALFQALAYPEGHPAVQVRRYPSE